LEKRDGEKGRTGEGRRKEDEKRFLIIYYN